MSYELFDDDFYDESAKELKGWIKPNQPEASVPQSEIDQAIAYLEKP